MKWSNELALDGRDVAASERAQGSIFFVGNATLLLSYAGFTILTDPNFLHRGDHVHLGHGMTAVRRTDPSLELRCNGFAAPAGSRRRNGQSAAEVPSRGAQQK